MRYLIAVCSVVVAIAATGAPVGAQSGYDLFQKALAVERVQGNLQEAIRLYERVVKQSAGDRALVARALLRIAECHEKLGQRDAAEVYARVVREFADQPDSVNVARARLNALQLPAVRSAQAARRVWSDGADATGGPSPDGRYLSFTDWSTGDLAIRDLAEGTNRQLTNTGGWQASGDFAEFSLISPDGTQVAYAWFTDKGSQPASACACRYDLRITGTNPGSANKPRVLRQTLQAIWIRPAAWTPDGRQLIIVRQVEREGLQLGVVPVTGDAPVRIIRSLGATPPRYVSVSPDGRFVAFDAPGAADGTARDIFVVALDGTRETPLVQGPADERAPVWMPDGSVVFLTDRTGADALWRVSVVDGKPSGTPVVLTTAISGRVYLLGATRGGALFYWSGGQNTNIYSVELDDRLTAKQEPLIAVERFVNSNFAPSWSADGQLLAYLSMRGSGEGPGSTVLLVHSIRTGEHREVPLTFVPVDRVTWFPDGRSVLLASRTVQGGARTLAFHRVDLSTGGAEHVHDTIGRGIPIHLPELSPDGKTIFDVDRITNSDPNVAAARLMRYDLDNRRETEVKRLTGADQYYTSMALSPDGAQLATLRSDGPARWSILEGMSTAGEHERELFRTRDTGPTRVLGLSWTRDSRHVVFVQPAKSMTEPDTALWKVAVAGGAPEPMGITMPGPIRLPTFHPNRQQITFSAAGSGVTPAVWVLENFLPVDFSRRR